MAKFFHYPSTALEYRDFLLDEINFLCSSPPLCYRPNVVNRRLTNLIKDLKSLKAN